MTRLGGMSLYFFLDTPMMLNNADSAELHDIHSLSIAIIDIITLLYPSNVINSNFLRHN
jgi:hypothetical protein